MLPETASTDYNNKWIYYSMQLEDGPVQSLPQCDHESTNVVTILTKLPINTPLGCQ